MDIIKLSFGKDKATNIKNILLFNLRKYGCVNVAKRNGHTAKIKVCNNTS